MQKRQYVLLAIIIVMALLGFRYLMFLDARHHLLCEVLKPGMSEDEVIRVLNQVGEFTMNRGEWNGGSIDLGISFTNANVRNKYGRFSIVFFDYKYARAVVSHGSDNPEYICDFYKPSKPATTTPKQPP